MADEIAINVVENIEQVLINVNEIDESTEVEIHVSEVLGQNGSSAYQIAVNNGFVGTEQQWLDSLKGADGADGAPGGSYVHNQGVPASVWNIAHNLGFFPNVTVVDSAGSKVIGDVDYVDINNLTITFSAGFSGKAYIS